MDRSVALPLLVAPVIGALLLASAPGRCAASCGCDRPGDRVLLISTRPVGCATDAERLAGGVLACERTHDACGAKWNESTAESLLGSLDPNLPTIFYVHGNQISACDARKRGLAVYRRLVACSCDERSLQFVIFSWCSDKIRGPLHDFRVKAARTRLIAGQLAWAINQTPPDAHVGLLGYSYGARVITGATHLLGGGALGSLTVVDNSHERTIRTAMLAPALDACWLRDAGCHGRALDRVESTLMTCNTKDPAMKYFRFSAKCYNPTALGFCGPKGLDADDRSRVRVCGVSGSVGRSHDLYRYLGAGGFMRATWRSLAFADSSTQSASPALADAG